MNLLASRATVKQFSKQGFAFVRELLDEKSCMAIAENILLAHAGSAGTRNLLAQRWCADLAHHLQHHPDISRLLPTGFRAVQCTYFEKSRNHNWLVPIHQDLSIPVAERIDAPDLQGWSFKEGTHYVQPPCEVLEQLVSLRLHLDPCSEEDGPISVVPGSHLAGRLTPEAARAARDAQPDQHCTADTGTVLIMRPMLLHASTKAQGNSRRRVLHFLFGPAELPLGLRWAAP